MKTAHLEPYNKGSHPQEQSSGLQSVFVSFTTMKYCCSSPRGTLMSFHASNVDSIFRLCGFPALMILF